MTLTSDFQPRSAVPLHWMPVDDRDAGPLKLILRQREFRSLGSGHRPLGLYRGLDGNGHAVTVRVVADSEAVA